MVKAFFTGLHPAYEEVLKQGLSAFVTNIFPDALVETINGFPDDQKAAFHQHIQNVGKAKLEETLKQIQNNISEQYTNPILNIVAALPKDELAVMAETLVSITSFMRRVSRVAETVGGPTDVAVISKKDGFVWIKRKHYFDRDVNYHFFTQPKLTGGYNDPESSNPAESSNSDTL